MPHKVLYLTVAYIYLRIPGVQALLLSHPRKSIRDTARFPPLMRATAPGRRPKPRALRFD